MIVIGLVIGTICPLVAILSYIYGKEEARKGPLFKFEEGCSLSRECSVVRIREVLQQVGIDQSKYSAHSFRIGAVTIAARTGIQDSLMKTLGHWESVAF